MDSILILNQDNVIHEETCPKKTILPHSCCPPCLDEHPILILDQTTHFALDDQNSLLIIKNYLDEHQLNQWIAHTLNTKRQRSTTIHDKLIPRYEAFYAVEPEMDHGIGILKTTPFINQFAQQILQSAMHHRKHLPWTQFFGTIDCYYDPELDHGGFIRAHSDGNIYGLSTIFSFGQTRYLNIEGYQRRTTIGNRTYYNKSILIPMNHNDLVCMMGPTFQKKYHHGVLPLRVDEPAYDRYSLNLRFLDPSFNSSSW